MRNTSAVASQSKFAPVVVDTWWCTELGLRGIVIRIKWLISMVRRGSLQDQKRCTNVKLAHGREEGKGGGSRRRLVWFRHEVCRQNLLVLGAPLWKSRLDFALCL